MPGLALMRSKLPTESGAVVSQFRDLRGLCIGELGPSAIDDCHLFLLLSCVKDWLPGWLGLRSASKRCMLEDVAAPVVKMGNLVAH